MFHKKRIIKFAIRLALVILIVLVSGFGLTSLTARYWDEENGKIVRLDSVRDPVILDRYNQSSDLPISDSQWGNWDSVKIEVMVTFLSGPNRGATGSVIVEQLEDDQLILKEGREYILTENTFADGFVQYSISDKYRLPWVFAFCFGAAVIVVVTTGKMGFRALISLLFSLMLLMKFYLPAVLNGYPPVALAMLLITVVSIVTVLLIVRRSSFWPVALFGIIGGIGSAFLFGYLAVKVWQLTGLGSDAGILLATTSNLDIPGIFLASVLIGATGAVHDVAISVASAMAEMTDYDNKISLARLWMAGRGVGKEVTGSMVNTLVLAYFGGALFTSLLITQNQTGFLAIFNDPMVSQEILQSLAGTAGLVFTAPITALFGIWWIKRLRDIRKITRKAK